MASSTGRIRALAMIVAAPLVVLVACSDRDGPQAAEGDARVVESEGLAVEGEARPVEGEARAATFPSVPGVEILSDISPVIAGRLPSLSTSGDHLLLYSGVDHAMEWDVSMLAASTDGGRTLRSLDVAPAIYAPAAVIVDDIAYVAGVVCEPPIDPEDPELVSCDQDSFRLALHAVSLEGDEQARELPIDGVGTPRAVGRFGDLAVFLVFTGEDVRLIGVGATGLAWERPIDAQTLDVCIVDGRLVAVLGSADHLMGDGGSIETVPMGDTIFAAAVSVDGGETWNPPVPFRSTEPNDYGIVIGRACGPSLVAAFTRQLGFFDPTTERWSVGPTLPMNTFSPGAGAAWRSTEVLRLWTSTAPDLSDTPIGAARGLGYADATSVEGEIDLVVSDSVRPGETAVHEASGAGGAADGYVIVREGARSYLGRVTP